MINLNNAADLPLEDPWEFLVVLVILAQHEDFAWEFVFLVLPFEELRVLVEDDLVFEQSEVAVMIVLVHLLDALDVGRVVAVVATAREQRVKSAAWHATKVNVINLITKIYKHSSLSRGSPFPRLPLINKQWPQVVFIGVNIYIT